MASLGRALLFPQGMALAARRGIPMLDLLASALGGVLAPISASPKKLLSADLHPSGVSAIDFARFFKDLLPSGNLSGATHLGTEGFGASGHEFCKFLVPSGCLSGATLLWKESFLGGSAPLGAHIHKPMITLPSNPGSYYNWSGNASSKINILCLGASAGFLLCNAKSSEECPPPPPPQPTPPPPGNKKEPEDDIQAVLRLLKKILNDMPVKELKKTTWIIKFLEGQFGPDATVHIVSLANLVKDQWDKFYLFVLFGLACFSLKITPLQGYRIFKYYLVEQQEGFQNVLAAYARNSEKKDQDDDSVSAVAFSVVNLETNELSQIQLFLRGEEGAAILSLLDDWALSQPRVKEGMELNQILLFLRSEDSAAILSRLQALAKGKPGVPSGKKDEAPSCPSY